MFAPIKYLLVDSAALLLINPAAAPLPRPRPVAVLEVWLTQGRSSVLSPVSSQEGGIFMFLCPGIDGSKLVNTHPQLKVRQQFSFHSPFHEQNGQMHVHLNCGIERCWQQQMLIAEIVGSFSRSALTWLMYRPRPCFDDGPQPYLWQTIFHTHYQGTKLMLRIKHFFVQTSL